MNSFSSLQKIFIKSFMKIHFHYLLFFLVLGQLPPTKIAPNRETKPNPNPNPNRGAIFLGGNSLADSQQ